MRIYAKSLENYQVEIKAGAHTVLADEPVDAGGDDRGPNPYDYLLAALASCKIITVHMYANRKDWPLEGVELGMDIQRVHAEDCEDCESNPNARVDIIETEIRFLGDLDQAQRDRLLEISERCPVHRTLTSETKIRTKQLA